MDNTEETKVVTLDVPIWMHEYMSKIAIENRRSLRSQMLFELEVNVHHVKEYRAKIAQENSEMSL